MNELDGVPKMTSIASYPTLFQAIRKLRISWINGLMLRTFGSPKADFYFFPVGTSASSSKAILASFSKLNFSRNRSVMALPNTGSIQFIV
ncbi:hypothetical protein CW304_20230 [Bacillus sp. UFRGS-B20]|nr:hypothetical protein CW304_20230 [Bacillus sp. UFRGS-B20]